MSGTHDREPVTLGELEAGETPRAKQMLERLDAAAAALPDDLEDAAADALVSAALPKPRPSRARFVLVGAAALAAGAALAVLFYPTDWPEPSVLAVQGEVTLDGAALQPLHGPHRIGRASVLATGATGAAAIHRSGGTVLLARHSTMKGRELVYGAALVEGSRLKVAAGAQTVIVDGRVLVTMEPAADPLRETPSEDVMKNDWMKLGPAVAGVGVAAALGVMVLSGDATILSAEAAPVKVAAGEQWKGKQKTKAVPAAPEAPNMLPAAGGDLEPDLKPLSREQLVARIEVLRNEKEQLLRERAVLQRSLDELRSGDGEKRDRRHRNYFVLTPDELKASAEKGELRLRVALGEEVTKVDARAADDVGLTPQEREAVNALYASSKQRILAAVRKLYLEMGGNEQVAWELAEETLLREIRAQSIKGDFANAIRQLANERAGLAPRSGANEGTIVFRAFRVVMEEDDRFVADVTALLGPARAEQFLNHANTPHSDNVFGVGPANKP